MIYDGKTYRNLQDQVGYLTGKYDDLQDQINDVRGKLTHYVVVDTLPTGDDIDPSAVYLLGPMGTAPDQYYEEWVYVQKADESWMWEKLGDTDSVDLSGYLPIQDGATTLPQVYGKTEAGVQAMINVDIAATAMTILFRDANGRTKVAAPDADGDAANKKYVVDNFVAKQTASTSERQVYSKAVDGSQKMIDAAQSVVGGAIPIRSSSGHLLLPDNPNNDSYATNKKYVDTNFLAKRTDTTTYQQAYFKATDGSQTMVNANSEVIANSVVLRDSNGRFSAQNPIDTYNVATKNYVDAAVGQLLYLHKLVLTFADVSGTDDLEVLVYLVNGSPTAITSPTTNEYCRMTPSHGLLGSNTVAITKFPPRVAYGNLDSPRWNGFMYQYFSGGNLISAVVDSDSYTMTVTDVVVNF